ncbi:MAG: UMP kinase, partial [Propionibacteriaceae bacterium]|nr:UMP kinase [Propionibacteriaceae bacterium]
MTASITDQEDNVPEPFHRVLLKLSGEAFGNGKLGVDPHTVRAIAKQIVAVTRAGTQISVVVGGGNYFR